MKTKIILLMVLVLFLTSCVDNNSSGTTSSWRTGTEGIVMSFLPDNPPSEVLSRGKVNVILSRQRNLSNEVKIIFEKAAVIVGNECNTKTINQE